MVGGRRVGRKISFPVAEYRNLVPWSCTPQINRCSSLTNELNAESKYEAEKTINYFDKVPLSLCQHYMKVSG
jgi:hypothetical protein